VNIIMDALLVPLFGVAAAALASVGAQLVGAAFLLRVLHLRYSSKQVRNVRVAATILTVPSRSSCRQIFDVAFPVFTMQLAKVLFYNSMTFIAAEAGTTALAANQLAFNFFTLFYPVGDALSSAALAYLPLVLLQGTTLQKRNLMLKLLGLSCGCGILDATLGVVLPGIFGCHVTSNAAVLAALRSVTQLMSISLLFNCIGVTLDGVLVATGRQGWLAKAYWINTGMLLVAAWCAGSTVGFDLKLVWVLMMLCNIVRVVECIPALLTKAAGHKEIQLEASQVTLYDKEMMRSLQLRAS